jgi:2-polyprenyl-3-methyl-5-hydroxy-6-metoxy-1,4-benzoquinol methylase
MQKHSLFRMLNWKRKLLCFLYYYLEVFSVKSRFVHRWYTKWIGNIFVDEFQLAEVTEQDQVLHIGCGSLPTMSILAATEAHVKVVAIDNDRKAIQRAKQYIASQHLSDRIMVEYGDGTAYPVHPFDVIFIATNVTPIDSMLQNLRVNAKPEARIICRDLGHGVIHLLQTREFSPYFSIHTVLTHQKSSSLLITKKE